MTSSLKITFEKRKCIRILWKMIITKLKERRETELIYSTLFFFSLVTLAKIRNYTNVVQIYSAIICVKYLRSLDVQTFYFSIFQAVFYWILLSWKLGEKEWRVNAFHCLSYCIFPTLYFIKYFKEFWPIGYSTDAQYFLTHRVNN